MHLIFSNSPLRKLQAKYCLICSLEDHMDRLTNIKYRKLTHVIIISDTIYSKILNLKARYRSDRPSLQRVKNSQSSSISCNFFRHPTLVPGNSCCSLFRWVLASALADSDAASHLACNLFALLRDISYRGKVGISPFHTDFLLSKFI